MNKRKKVIASLFLFAVIWWLFCLPDPLFNTGYSTVVLDKDGQLLSARIARDEQWRFPPRDTIPEKFKTCIVAFEDRRFYDHLGVSFAAVFRALRQNIKASDVVSGASTITMQLMRMSRKADNRSIYQKAIETAWATRAEWRYSKDEILSLYAAHAPFGGNVVGLEAASWRYFSRPPDQLTWAESATLAVLPNAPGLIYPGRNQKELRKKRDRLLDFLRDEGSIDSLTCTLSKLENLPITPQRLPNLVPHLTNKIAKDGGSQKITKTTLSKTYQEDVADIVERNLVQLRTNNIRNAAVLLTDIETGEIHAYVGNGHQQSGTDGSANDMIETPRSSGSILKPLLYASMVDDGAITPFQIIPDIPSNFGGFSPSNYNKSYLGAVHANYALARSLNIPAVRMLKRYGVPKFHQRLKEFGLTTIHRNPKGYGLSLILGGAETTLFDLVSTYRNLAHQVKVYPVDSKHDGIHYHRDVKGNENWPVSAGASWATLQAMALVNRPNNVSNWNVFSGAEKVAWKTGTSYGYRDAWAVGISGNYVVGVWVGNADGEGRPGISGIEAAAPLLFEVINRLPKEAWFSRPDDELVEENLCTNSGMIAGSRCPEIQKALVPLSTQATVKCGYCRSIYTDKTKNYRVHKGCTQELYEQKWFALPGLMEYYFKRKNASYKSIPPYRSGCEPKENLNQIQILYPKDQSNIYLPQNLDGSREMIVLKAAHPDKNATLYWHLDGTYLGETKGFHTMEIGVEVGVYPLLIIDDLGNIKEVDLRVQTKTASI